MRVMTFNIRSDSLLDVRNRWESRKEIVREVINKYKCDIIGFQEVKNKMLEDIKQYLNNYNFVGEGRTKRLFRESNNIFVTKKCELMEEDTFWLSNNSNKVGSSIWYSLFPRICTTVAIRTEDGKCIRIYNTHLDCLFPMAREYGIKKITEYMEEQYKKDNLPVVLMGDFNATPDSKVIRSFRGGEYTSQKFIAVQEINKEIYKESTMNWFKGKETGMHIDYVFVSEGFKIKSAEIIKYNRGGKYPSDHYPIMADIEILSYGF